MLYMANPSGLPYSNNKLRGYASRILKKKSIFFDLKYITGY